MHLSRWVDASRWFDTPQTTRAFFWAIYPRKAASEVPLTESDILGPSEGFRQPVDYFAHSPQTNSEAPRLARRKPSLRVAICRAKYRVRPRANFQAPTREGGLTAQQDIARCKKRVGSCDKTATCGFGLTQVVDLSAEVAIVAPVHHGGLP